MTEEDIRRELAGFQAYGIIRFYKLTYSSEIAPDERYETISAHSIRKDYARVIISLQK
jgi:hypothetical protein